MVGWSKKVITDGIQGEFGDRRQGDIIFELGDEQKQKIIILPPSHILPPLGHSAPSLGTPEVEDQ